MPDTHISDRILVEVRDNIAHVQLNRPDKYNGLDLAMMHALAGVPRRLRADRELRAVILSGAGEAFCAGLDFASVAQQQRTFLLNILKVPGGLNLYQRACWNWRTLSVPVIAAIHGYCFGGGFQLALACDFRIATPDSKISILEGKWGLIPDMTGSVTLRELVPMDVAMRLTMTAETFDGRTALEYGLVSELSDEPLVAAQALADQLATRSPDALAASKALLHRTWSRAPRWAFWTETFLQGRLLIGVNHKIARVAGMKREPARFERRTLR